MKKLIIIASLLAFTIAMTSKVYTCVLEAGNALNTISRALSDGAESDRMRTQARTKQFLKLADKVKTACQSVDLKEWEPMMNRSDPDHEGNKVCAAVELSIAQRIEKMITGFADQRWVETATQIVGIVNDSRKTQEVCYVDRKGSSGNFVYKALRTTWAHPIYYLSSPGCRACVDAKNQFVMANNGLQWLMSGDPARITGTLGRLFILYANEIEFCY